MQTPKVTYLGQDSGSVTNFKPCGHRVHVGVCKYCQRHKAAALKVHNIASEQAYRRWRDEQAKREASK